jgi:DNA-directed RNA polymerase III subunit RPC6
VLDAPEYKNGISNSELKKLFGSDYISLAPVINDLTAESRLTMSQNAATGELFYQLVSAEVAQQFQGLDVSAKMVYQVIEKAGNMGIWTKDIRVQTNIQQQALNKIFKVLESRLLIKPVKSVTAKSKKLYMLYNLVPSKGACVYPGNISRSESAGSPHCFFEMFFLLPRTDGRRLVFRYGV